MNKFVSLCFAQERVSRELLCTLGFWPLCLSISGRHFCLLALPNVILTKIASGSRAKGDAL